MSEDPKAPGKGAADQKQPDPPEAAALLRPPGTVSIRVLPKGAGQIHKGTHSLDEQGKTQFDVFAKGDIVHGCEASNAAMLEDRGWVEILDVE